MKLLAPLGWDWRFAPSRSQNPERPVGIIEMSARRTLKGKYMNKALDPIKDLVEEGYDHRFVATEEPYLSKEQGGWLVVGEYGTGARLGWFVFDAKADATNFFEHFKDMRYQ